MTKISLALASTLAASATAFAPAPLVARSSVLNAGNIEFAEVGGEPWDPLGLGLLGKNIDTFPSMFPDSQFLRESEIKQGRMAMLAWTGVWATHQVGKVTDILSCTKINAGINTGCLNMLVFMNREGLVSVRTSRDSQLRPTGPKLLAFSPLSNLLGSLVSWHLSQSVKEKVLDTQAITSAVRAPKHLVTLDLTHGASVSV
jgi:hypothetical protein